MGRGFGFSSIKAASPQREQVVESASLEWLEKTQRAQYPLIKEYGLHEKGLHKRYSLIKGYWALWGPASVLRFRVQGRRIFRGLEFGAGGFFLGFACFFLQGLGVRGSRRSVPTASVAISLMSSSPSRRCLGPFL